MEDFKLMPAPCAQCGFHREACNHRIAPWSTKSDTRQRVFVCNINRNFLTILSFVLILFCVEITLPVTHGNPVTSRENDSSAEISDFSEGVDFLLQYAYLPQSDLETGHLRTQDELRESIKTFQRYARLDETGEFDEPTRTKMMAPRCGLPDMMENTPGGEGKRRKRYVLGPSKWKKRHLTYKIENHTPKLRYGEVRLAIDKAFKIWSAVTYLTFREVSRTSQADINIRFARGYHSDGYPFDGSGRVLAHAFYPGEDRGGDTHFDEDEPWTLYETPEKGIDLFTVAAHEFGHALGLAHSHTLRALMYPWYQGYSENFQLHNDDVTAIQILYGKKTSYRPKTTPVNPPYSPITRRPTTRTTTTTTRRPTTTTTLRPTTEPAWSAGDCNGQFDAISYIRGEYYMFKGKYFWRANAKGLMSGFPLLITQFWYGFPDDLKDIHIDAVYERKLDYKILFFVGKRYYLFHGNHLASHFPTSGKPLTDLGLPADIEKIDAAFVWAHNGKTYFISNDMYWKYDETTRSIEKDYPRPMAMWQGVQVPVTTVITEKNKKTYFVKGELAYEFDNAFMKVSSKQPQTCAEKWLNCSLNAVPTTMMPTNMTSLGDPNSQVTPMISLLLMNSLLLICLAFVS